MSYILKEALILVFGFTSCFSLLLTSVYNHLIVIVLYNYLITLYTSSNGICHLLPGTFCRVSSLIVHPRHHDVMRLAIIGSALGPSFFEPEFIKQVVKNINVSGTGLPWLFPGKKYDYTYIYTYLYSLIS